ncbi:MAG: UvrD-helicase domain-containing protein [Clostridia bacterium]|nr:UvrD-helicase domain-containing protein [Clostridia bacterium]
MINEKQNEIIKERNKNLFVSASAGSGKTFTMIERIFDLISFSKISLGNMLVLTYTNSAATEMKQKLLNKLNDEIKKLKDKKFLQEQIDLLPTADISTFHSFYEKLIKNYYYKLNINPAFAILSETENEIIKEKAFKSAADQFKETSDYFDLFSALNTKRKEKPIKECVFKLDEFLCSVENKENWLKNNALKLISDKRISEKILLDNFKEELKFFKRKFEKALVKSSSLGVEKLSAHINSILASLEEFLRADFEFAINNAELFKIEKFTFPKDLDEIFVADIKKLREKTKECFADFLDQTQFYKDFEKDQENLKIKYNLFVEFYLAYKDNLQKLKMEENKWDFADIETFAIKLLEDEEILKEIKEKYTFVFVDEFQDVNQVQDKFVSLIANDNNLFLVGDPKQSIYAFRQSDVSLFLNRLNSQKDSTSVKNLLVNFRSDERILNFCNKIFSKLITTKSAEIDYLKTSMFEASKKFENEFLPVNLFLTKKEEKQKKTEKTNVYKVFDAEIGKEESINEAEMIVEEISNLLSKKIYDEKIGAKREITYSDIAIIVRSRGALSENLVNIFNRLNIPYIYNVSRNLKEFKSVLALISALKLASEYYSETDLAVVLNRFFNLSFEDLSKIKLFNQEEKFSVNVFNYNLDDAIFKKLNIFKNTLLKFKLIIETNGLYDAVNYLISNSSIFEFIKTIEGCEEEKDALREFLQLLLNSGCSNLIEFISLVDSSQNLSIQTENTVLDNKITITTIHSSKGLEYPIVFLSDLCKNLKNSKRDNIKIIINKENGIYLNTNEENSTEFLNSAIKILNYESEFKENLRLLYVGMTRAKSALYLTGEISEFNFESLTEDDLKFCPQNFMAFILGALNEKELETLKENNCFKNEGFSFKIYETFNKHAKAAEENKQIDALKLRQINNIKYNYENSSLSQKISVSELLKDEEYELICDCPKDLSFSEHLNFSDEINEVGTAVHKMMENLEISDDIEKIKNSYYECFNSLKSKDDEKIKSEIISSCAWALCELKKFMEEGQVIKEKKFMINAPVFDILGYGSKEKVLIQGIIDFAYIGKKIILVDYKYSSIKDEKVLKEKYKNQLAAYKFALQKFLHRNVDEVYIFNLKTKQKIKL